MDYYEDILMKITYRALSAALLLGAAGVAHSAIIIDNNTGGLYNNGIGDLSLYYDASQFPGPNSSEGDPTVNPLAEPTFFTPEFGADWLNGDYTGGTWASSLNIPNNWAVNSEVAIVYDFDLLELTDIHIDFGVDNGIYVWLDGTYVFGAMAPGGASINEYDLDLTALSAGSHSLQILLEDHGGATGYQIAVDAVTSTAVVPVPEPGSMGLIGLGLLGLMGSRRLRR